MIERSSIQLLGDSLREAAPTVPGKALEGGALGEQYFVLTEDAIYHLHRRRVQGCRPFTEQPHGDIGRYLISA